MKSKAGQRSAQDMETKVRKTQMNKCFNVKKQAWETVVHVGESEAGVESERENKKEKEPKNINRDTSSIIKLPRGAGLTDRQTASRTKS